MKRTVSQMIKYNFYSKFEAEINDYALDEAIRFLNFIKGMQEVHESKQGDRCEAMVIARIAELRQAERLRKIKLIK